MSKELSIVTYNLRCSWSGDGANSFFARAGLILKKIYSELPDIICFQEAVPSNMSILKKHLADTYTVIFNQREKDFSGEGLAVAFRRERISLYGLEVFWLSGSPYTVASKFEGQSMHSRICQNMMFRDELTGKVFRIYNLHLEELTESVRVKQIQLVGKRIVEDKKRMDLPYFILGDLNAEPGGDVISCCNNSFPDKICDLTSDINGSFHDFGRRTPAVKIDYIFADAATAGLSHNTEVWDDCINGIYLSDHYPIRLNIEL